MQAQLSSQGLGELFNAVAADEAEHAGRWELVGSSASFKGICGALTPHQRKPLTH